MPFKLLKEKHEKPRNDKTMTNESHSHSATGGGPHQNHSPQNPERKQKLCPKKVQTERIKNRYWQH